MNRVVLLLVLGLVTAGCSTEPGPLGTPPEGITSGAVVDPTGVAPGGLQAWSFGIRPDAPLTSLSAEDVELLDSRGATVEEVGLVDLTPTGAGGGFSALVLEDADGDVDPEAAELLATDRVTPAGTAATLGDVEYLGWYVLVRLDDPDPAWDGFRLTYTADGTTHRHDVRMEVRFES